MSTAVLGLDVGGANLKAVHTDGTARTLPFALWKRSTELPAALAELLRVMPRAEQLAVTMTGELCDCFEVETSRVSRPFWMPWSRQGKAGGVPVRVLAAPISQFACPAEAKETHLLTASANWHALATWAGRLAPEGPGLLVDIGSTTTDIIPLLNGKPAAKGETDPERLRTSELVYFGVRRTPLMVFMRGDGAAELFATSLDLFLLIGWNEDDPNDCDTADGRPATRAQAHLRLARMLCADLRNQHRTGAQGIDAHPAATRPYESERCGALRGAEDAGTAANGDRGRLRRKAGAQGARIPDGVSAR